MKFKHIFAYPARFRCIDRVFAAWFLMLAAVVIVLFPGNCPAGSAQPEVGAIRIQVAGDARNVPEIEKIARSLITLDEGEPFSDAAFSRSVAALQRSGLFSEIHIPDPDWSKTPIELVFRLTAYARIKSIRINGGFPLFETEIRNVMSMEPGDACVPEKISGQKEEIESLFSAEGYIRPRVSLSSHRDPEDGRCILDVNIRKGPFYRVEAVRFEGNRRFSSARLKMRLETWQSSLLLGGPSRFVEKQLEQDVKTLRQFYRSKGYPEAEIDSELTKNPETGDVRIRFVISEGPRYRVSFTGNEAFWGFTLKKDLVLFSEGNKSGFGLRKSIRNIRQRYREAGFPDMQIDTKEQNLQGNGLPVKKIRFRIQEGPRYIVDSVAISGNSAFDSDTLKKQMLTAPPAIFHEGAYVPETLAEDIRAIQALYTQAGYADAAVEEVIVKHRAPGTEGEIPVSVTLSIEEGPKTIVSNVSITGENPIPEEKAIEQLSMKPGTPYREYRVKSDQNTLAAAISEKGYPHVSVEPGIVISPDQTGARLTYTVDPGPRVEMGEVFFIGNFHTRRRVLDRELEISPGEPFSLSRMLASQRNIRSINAVRAARFETFGLDTEADRVDMITKIQEIRPYFVELASGYDTQRLFYVHAATGNRNLFGLNKQGRVSLEWSQIGYRADLDYSEPKLLGTQVSAISNLYAEKREELNQNFGVRNYGASQGFSRHLTPRLSASLNFRYESRDQYRLEGPPVPEEEAEQYRSRSLVVASPGLAYISTDAFLRPSSGVRATVTLDASRGLDNSLDDFLKYRLDARYYNSPLNRLTLAFHGRVGYIDPYGGDQRVPEDQLFFLGGTATIRGFDENRLRFDENGDPVGGRTSLLASAEVRYDLGMNFELAAFYDTGAIRNPLRDAGSGEFRSAAGLGLRYITPIGPIGGMYGWKLDRKPGESPGAFHFAIGYTF